MLNTWNCLPIALHLELFIKDDVERIYYGLCDTAFKEKHRNHTSSFKNEKKKEIEMKGKFPITSWH